MSPPRPPSILYMHQNLLTFSTVYKPHVCTGNFLHPWVTAIQMVSKNQGPQPVVPTPVW